MTDSKRRVVKPRDLAASELWRRINSDDPHVQMPPREANLSLSDEEVALLKKWIEQGAPWTEHWSFVPPLKLDPPAAGKDVGAKPIDRFINARLKNAGLSPSPESNKERLIRRITLDLTGLPPSLEEVDAFLSDDSPAAYERVVDRLLASPKYGERMAAEWLDVARYSDTYGYQVDRDRFVWPWRDWVIRAFNKNMHFDDFITEQLAGDLLPEATEDQVLATTFNRLNPQKVEGGSVEEEFRVEYVVDRAQTVSTAFLGLTFECARCHDHKFDPLSQKEFYELNAFFANINEAGLYSYHTDSIPTPTLRLPTGKQRKSLAAAEQAVAEAEETLQQAVNAVRNRGHDLNSPEAKVSGPVASQDFDDPSDKLSKFDLVDGVAGKGVRLSGDRGVHVGPAAFRRWQPFSVALWMQTPDVKQRAVVFHQSLGWTDAASRGYQLLIEEGRLSAALVHFWPGNAVNVRTTEPIPTGEWLHVAMTYDGSSRADGLQLFVNGEPVECETLQDGLTKEITAGKNTDITIGERTRDRGFTNGLVDGFEVYDRRLTRAEVRARANQEPLAGLLSPDSVAAMPSLESEELLAQHIDAACRSAREALQSARQKRDELLDGIQEIMVMRELPDLRETYVLDRGMYDARKERVSPNTPAALPPMPAGAPKNRLGLAQWLTTPNHPLTARVAVNRYWQLMFGRGLVVTTEDFGSQSSPPSHPDLLDWLTHQFVDSGWDVKQLLKTMALSDAYQRDSVGVDGSETKDPENIWLARGPAGPLTAEMIRDSALATSGLLSPTIGGPPAKPYELAVSFVPVDHDHGDGLYRRSLYTYWKRTAPAPVMVLLDASTRDVCRVRRERTSSPLQAMVLLNGPQYVEAARGAAGRVLEESEEDSTVDQRLERLFRMLTSRSPDAEEQSIIKRLYTHQHGAFSTDPASADKYLLVGESKPSADVDRLELAAMAMVAQAIMNLDDYLVKR